MPCGVAIPQGRKKKGLVVYLKTTYYESINIIPYLNKKVKKILNKH